MGQERLGPSCFFIPLVLGPLNSLLFFSRGLGRRMHLAVEVTESSTNKQHQKKKVVPHTLVNSGIVHPTAVLICPFIAATTGANSGFGDFQWKSLKGKWNHEQTKSPFDPCPATLAPLFLIDPWFVVCSWFHFPLILAQLLSRHYLLLIFKLL